MARKTKPLRSTASVKKHKTGPVASSLPFMIEKHLASSEVVNAHELVARSDLPSATKARLVLTWLLYPVSPDEFYAKYWEQAPVVIKRQCPRYYDGWFSTAELERILTTHTLEYGTDLDLTKYVDQTRHTLNPSSSTATAEQVRRHFHDGCSVRLLCPQKFSDPVWHLLATLEDEWGCMAGANAYWTPHGTQGFAPHFDDIEAFVLQLEGCKHWKVYKPVRESDVLARYPSGNFGATDDIGPPLVEVDLEAGDFLYFPRGFIHQARAQKERDSLHLTVSTGQENSMGHLLQLLVPQALEAAVTSNVALRRSLPRDYLDYMGVMHSDRDEDANRRAFTTQVKSALKLVLGEAMEMVDAASDQMAKKFLLDRLPPALDDDEETCTRDRSPLHKITVQTQLKLIRHHVARLVIEDGKAVVYHCRDNARRHHEVPVSPLEFELDDAESIEFILTSYPDAFCVGDLPHDDPHDQIELTKALYNEGLLRFLTA
ncbi:hypothetical protein PsorP6_006681 [Peronosclerospora sorghi]|uniref:Uncharacterized protein n=1 Tax=Peronosclerospora sorghi TaxID=230839 RepID=A0ACC0W3N2_9STRA|nr:hypothetical protein PsorP6_006681 [Peronosclerospora sorghi]